MRSIFVLALLMTLLATPSGTVADELKVGRPAPNATLEFINGQTVALSDLLGKKPIYLKMWATWCKPCRDEMPHLQGAFERHGDDIAVIAINAGFNDTAEEVKAFQERFDLTLPMAIDRSGNVGQQLNLIATPYHVVIGRDGVVIHTGHKASPELDDKLMRVASPSATPAAEPIVREHVPLSTNRNVAPGDPAPLFTIKTTEGTEFTLADARRDEPVHLYFFTTWCESYLNGDGNDPQAAAACKESRDAISGAYTDSNAPVNVIGIASRLWTGPEELQNFVSNFHPKYPVALDSTNEVFQLYGVRQFPTLITVINGRVTSRHDGGLATLN